MPVEPTPSAARRRVETRPPPQPHRPAQPAWREVSTRWLASLATGSTSSSDRRSTWEPRHETSTTSNPMPVEPTPSAARRRVETRPPPQPHRPAQPAWREVSTRWLASLATGSTSKPDRRSTWEPRHETSTTSNPMLVEPTPSAARRRVETRPPPQPHRPAQPAWREVSTRWLASLATGSTSKPDRRSTWEPRHETSTTSNPMPVEPTPSAARRRVETRPPPQPHRPAQPAWREVSTRWLAPLATGSTSKPDRRST